jgi:hypothetical protein
VPGSPYMYELSTNEGSVPRSLNGAACRLMVESVTGLSSNVQMTISRKLPSTSPLAIGWTIP